MEKVLITGASGFIGKNLVRFLLANNYNVIAYSRSQVALEGVQWIKGDILDSKKLTQSLNGCSTVIHLAAITPYKQINSYPIDTFNCYIQGTINVLKAMYEAEVKTLFFPSSGKVYGSNNALPFTEVEKPLPDILMGKLKAKSEELIQIYANLLDSNYRFIILRMFNVYGVDQSSQFLIPKLINHIDIGQIKLGPINFKRDYIHIQDILSAINILMEKAPSGFSVYNIGSGQSISIREIVDILCNLSGKTLKVINDDSQIRRDEREIEQADVNKLCNLGWQPRISLDKGLSELLNYHFQTL